MVMREMGLRLWTLPKKLLKGFGNRLHSNSINTGKPPKDSKGLKSQATLTTACRARAREFSNCRMIPQV